MKDEWPPARFVCHGETHTAFQAGQEGFEPPSPGFGVRCSTVRATGLQQLILSRFPVKLVLTTETTIFSELESLRGAPLIFRRCVVATPAFNTRQSNQVPHGHSSHCFQYSQNKAIKTPPTDTRHPRKPKGCYARISLTTPAPTVRPPSRIAKRNSFSKAIGVINSTSTPTLSPGITISVPDGNVTTPVTSVVRK